MSAGLALGIIVALVGLAALTFGLVTGDMPPFPNKYIAPREWAATSRSEDPFQYWASALFYAAIALYGAYVVVRHLPA